MISLMIAAAAMAPAMPGTLYVCGDDQVRELRIGVDGVRESWRWTAASADDLPPEYRTGLLDHIDECKPVEDGRAILMTSSTGGAVLIDRATGSVRFHAKVPMAHSAALLPGGLIAVALSIHEQGNRLALYDRRHSDVVLQTLPLPSGHGAVWDAKRKRLFTLSHDLVQAFRIDHLRAGPRLRETARWTLPGKRDGHDLSPGGDGRYLVTTEEGAWLFDPGNGRFGMFAPLYPRLRVKAVSVAHGRIAWVQAEEKWWAHGFTIAAVDGTGARRVPVEGMRLYKVRWLR